MRLTIVMKREAGLTVTLTVMWPYLRQAQHHHHLTYTSAKRQPGLLKTTDGKLVTLLLALVLSSLEGYAGCWGYREGEREWNNMMEYSQENDNRRVIKPINKLCNGEAFSEKSEVLHYNDTVRPVKRCSSRSREYLRPAVTHQKTEKPESCCSVGVRHTEVIPWTRLQGLAPNVGNTRISFLRQETLQEK